MLTPSMDDPQPGQVYLSPAGAPMLFVRKEERPRYGEQFFFVETRKGVVFQRWADETPEGATLIHDPAAQERARGFAALLGEEEAKTAALSAALKRAVLLLPLESAAELRRIYTETFNHEYSR